MTMFEKKKNLTPWATPVPQSPTPGAWPRRQKKSCLIFLILSFVRTHTKFGIKIFEIDFVIEIKWYLTFWPLPRAPGGGAKRKFYIARPIHVSNSHTKFSWISSNGLGGDSITDRQQGRIDFCPLVPPSPTPRAWPRRQNKNPFWYVLYLSFVRTHTKFGIKIFEIDFVIEIKWYLTFWPLPRAPVGGAKKFFLRCTPHSCE